MDKQRLACKRCNGDIPLSRMKRHPVYCGEECASQWHREAWTKRNRHSKIKLSASVIGAMHELLVSADLFKMGYSVFRSLSPSAPCDIVILKNGKLLRVEITTGILSSTGKIYNAKMYKPKKVKEQYDVLAIAFKGKITYEPESF